MDKVHIVTKEKHKVVLCNNSLEYTDRCVGWDTYEGAYESPPTCEICILLAFQYPEYLFKV